MADLIYGLVIGSLIMMNILQFIYWSRDHDRLIDKLMSRNYAEYVTSKEYRQPPPKAPATPLEISIQDQAGDEAVLDELNRAMGR